MPDSSLSYNACWSCDLTGPHAGRQEILQTHIHKQGLPLGADVTVDSIAASTTGFTGADLANLINEAALLAGRSGKGNPRRQHPSQRAHLCLFVAELAFWFVEFAFGFLPSRCRGRLLVAELEGNLAVQSAAWASLCSITEVTYAMRYSTVINSSKSSSECQISESVLRSLEHNTPQGSTCHVQSCCYCSS